MRELIDGILKDYKGKRVAIYGTGLNAERVIQMANNHNFSCVISNDKSVVGTKFFGLNVLELKDALFRSDVILIAAIPSSARAVYDRIKNKVPESIPIFNLSGIRMNKKEGYKDCSYWNTKYEDLIDAIDEHEVISFDIFDTILMRKLIHPRTIFGFIDDKYNKKKCRGIVDYPGKRIEAEDIYYKRGEHPTIYDVYDSLKVDSDNGKDTILALLDDEILCEHKFIARREDIYKAFRYALSRNKKIYFLSDMYLTKNIIESVLSEHGISGYTDLLVSCEEKCNKSSGSLFEVLKDKTAAEKILHIGDNYDADIAGAKKANVDTFQVYSSEQLLMNSSIRHITSSVKSSWEEILLGHILCKIEDFNNAFKLGMHKGKVYMESVEMLTDQCFVPITMAYMSWLIKQLRDRPNDVVLFASRDGYLLEKIYRKIRENNSYLRLPESIYFYTSRRAMSDTISRSEDGIRALCSNLDQYRKVDIIKHLEKVFGVSLNEELSQYKGKKFDEINSEQLIVDLLNKKDKIVDHAVQCSKRYQKYIEQIKLSDYEEIFLVDLVAQGSSRYGISKLIDREVKLLALGTTKLPNAFIDKPYLSNSMFGQMITGIGSAVSTMFNLLEMAYASRNGQLIGFDELGKPLFDDRTKYNSDLLDKIQDEIVSFLGSYADEEWFLREYSTAFADDMLGILASDYSDVSEELIKAFDFYDQFDEADDRFNVLNRVRGDE